MSESKAWFKKAMKQREMYLKMQEDARTYTDQANAFFEDFKKRKEKPYKQFRLIGSPVNVRNDNRNALKGCTTIGVRTTFDQAVESALSSYRIAFANPDNIELDDFKKMISEYKKIFFSLHMSSQNESCAKFVRLFKKELKDKIESLFDGFSSIDRKLKSEELNKAANALVKEVVQEETKKELSKFAQPPSGAFGGGGTRKRRGKRTRRVRRGRFTRHS